MADPWDRRENESPRAYWYFRSFLDLPRPRKIATLAEETEEVSYKALRAYSSRNKWAERADAWDAASMRAEDEITIEHVKRRRQRYLRALDMMLEKGIEGISVDYVPKFSTARGMIVDAIKLAQLLLGEATERVEQQDQINLTRLNSEQVWILKNILLTAGSIEPPALPDPSEAAGKDDADADSDC